MNLLVIITVGLAILGSLVFLVIILHHAVSFGSDHEVAQRKLCKCSTSSIHDDDAKIESCKCTLPIARDFPSHPSSQECNMSDYGTRLRCTMAGCPIPDFGDMKPNFSVNIPPREHLPRRYNFFPHRAGSGEVLSFEPTLQYRPDELATACDTTPGCVGFDSDGTLLKSVTVQSLSTRSHPDGIDGTYVATDYPMPLE